MAGPGSDGENNTLARRLDKLFRSVRRPDGSEFSYTDVAEAIVESGEPISRAYIGRLRSGEKSNPTLRTLQALARFFGVPAEYFLSDTLAASVDVQLDALAAMQELKATTIRMRQTVLPDAERDLKRLTELVAIIRSLGEPASDDGQQPTPDAT